MFAHLKYKVWQKLLTGSFFDHYYKFSILYFINDWPIFRNSASKGDLLVIE
ncbi:MAG: hypothetical protein HW380_1960 [Magnetococcales bacterium]|nr:hypothetical protein [Magnetococcales bacterium]